jgi:hypothetical protein
MADEPKCESPPELRNVDHERIWLQPKCFNCAGEERSWCKDNVWIEGCDPVDCHAVPTEYVRADLVTQPAEVEKLRADAERLRGVLGEIARQKKSDEVSNYDKSDLDFEAGFDGCIDAARAALAASGEHTP